ncbi:MAG: hypothetical protein CEN92_215 [Candidatus Berkelbacteria bacterium Licking1014_96]|uniref:Uncharacterized protein n=1 Tax=Candidatus Berkelbacteria bacterium Licking1014_96 TaxID=2017149 RepID=A0A554LFT6_9BACT|nr:MAG: hypothetical protein CEN92_215 [Candidatus Berkelbacteria bacterium Licking1014_96]
MEKDIKGGLRRTRDNYAATMDLSKMIKLCMGEKTMLKNQMERIEMMVGEQGLMPQNQRLAKALAENQRREAELDRLIEENLSKK